MSELGTYLNKMKDRIGTLKTGTANTRTGHAEFDYDLTGNSMGMQDIYFPIKGSEIREAKIFIDKMIMYFRQAGSSYLPLYGVSGSMSVSTLYDMIDKPAP